MNPDISGEWTGVLDTGTVKVSLNFTLEPTGDGGVARLSTRSYGELALPLSRRGSNSCFSSAAPPIEIFVYARSVAGFMTSRVFGATGSTQVPSM